MIGEGLKNCNTCKHYFVRECTIPNMDRKAGELGQCASWVSRRESLGIDSDVVVNCSDCQLLHIGGMSCDIYLEHVKSKMSGCYNGIPMTDATKKQNDYFLAFAENLKIKRELASKELIKQKQLEKEELLKGIKRETDRYKFFRKMLLITIPILSLMLLNLNGVLFGVIVILDISLFIILILIWKAISSNITKYYELRGVL